MTAACGRSTNTNLVGPSLSKCAVSATNNTPAVPAAGGAGTITVTAQRECAWSAQAQASWITLSGAAGQGAATVKYTVALNPNGSPRRGQVVVSEQSIEVVQEAAACRYAVTPSSMDVAAPGGDVTVNLTSPGGCTWRAGTGVAWVSRVAPAQGAGSATVRLAVAPNTGEPRHGTVTIAGVAVQLRQAGPGVVAPPPPPAPPPPAPPPSPGPCTYQLKPGDYNAGRGPDDIRVRVTAPSGCAWTASSPVAWVVVAGAASGTGDGTVRLLVEANNGPERTAKLTIAGAPFQLRQNGCSASIKPSWYDAGRGPDDIRIAVTADGDCTWTATSTVPWVKVNKGATGSGKGTVRLLVEPNSGDERSATLIIAGQAFHLRQLGSK